MKQKKQLHSRITSSASALSFSLLSHSCATAGAVTYQVLYTGSNQSINQLCRSCCLPSSLDRFTSINQSLQELAAKGDPGDGKAIHVLSSGLKAAATWGRVEILQQCRECCGGQGFLAANKIGPMKTDMDVDVTFEGDNTVMMQQVSSPVSQAAAACACLCPWCCCPLELSWESVCSQEHYVLAMHPARGFQQATNVHSDWKTLAHALRVNNVRA